MVASSESNSVTSFASRDRPRVQGSTFATSQRPLRQCTSLESFDLHSQALRGKSILSPRRLHRADHSNQQYSILALTDTSGAVVERVAYTANGYPTTMNGVGVISSSSATANRILFTGREWDKQLDLYHFRARWVSSVSGCFLRRDPIGYFDSTNVNQFALFNTLQYLDPSGLLNCSSQNHHWFPQAPSLRPQIEARCAAINFNVDFFTTPLQRCSDPDKRCNAHGWLHGYNTPGVPRRAPDWNEEVRLNLVNTRTCCEFLIGMAYSINNARFESLQNFNIPGCVQNSCETRTSNPPSTYPETHWPLTDNMLDRIVEACRAGRQPNPMPNYRDVIDTSVGIQQDYTIEEFFVLPTLRFPWRSLPRIKFPSLKMPSTSKTPPVKYPVELPPRRLPGSTSEPNPIDIAS